MWFASSSSRVRMRGGCSPAARRRAASTGSRPWAQNRFRVSITRSANGVVLPAAVRAALYSLRIMKPAFCALAKIGLRDPVMVMQKT